MRIGILSCIYGRDRLTECFCIQMKRLKKLGAAPLIVGSEGKKSQKIVEKYNIAYIEAPNSPLGAKFNKGMRTIRILQPDYVMILGSDDFITDNYFRLILNNASKGWDMIGMLDAYFYNYKDEKLGYWPGYTKETHRQGETIGLGRTLSKKLLDKCGWSPWIDRLERGLDGSMTARLAKYKPAVRKLRHIDESVFSVDIKTGKNITGFGCFANQVHFKHISNELMSQISEFNEIKKSMKNE